MVVEALADTPAGTDWVLGKVTMMPALTEFPMGSVPWYDVTVYCRLALVAWRFHDDETEPEGRARLSTMLFIAHVPEL